MNISSQQFEAEVRGLKSAFERDFKFSIDGSGLIGLHQAITGGAAVGKHHELSVTIRLIATFLEKTIDAIRTLEDGHKG